MTTDEQIGAKVHEMLCGMTRSVAARRAYASLTRLEQLRDAWAGVLASQVERGWTPDPLSVAAYSAIRCEERAWRRELAEMIDLMEG